MDMDSLITADTQRRGVHKTDSRTLSQENFLDINDERNNSFLFKFNEAVIGYQPGEQVFLVLADMLFVEMFQTAIPGSMEQDHDNHSLRI